NKNECGPTSGRSTNYGSGHLIPAFRGTRRIFSWLCISCCVVALSPVGGVKVPGQIRYVEFRCFVRNYPAFGHENPARVFALRLPATGRGLGNPHGLVCEAMLLLRAPSGQQADAREVPSGSSAQTARMSHPRVAADNSQHSAR